MKFTRNLKDEFSVDAAHMQTVLISSLQRNEIDQDYRENFREMDRLYGDNAQMKAKIEQLEDENKNLEAGLKEVMEAMKKYPGVPEGEGMEKGEREVMAMQFPTLERMLAVSRKEAFFCF